MESYSIRDTSVLAKFNISNSIDDALRLVGYDVYGRQWTDAGAFPDMKGYSVFDNRGDYWGTVIRLNISGPRKLLEVQSDEGVIMVPFEETFVVEINESDKKILLDPPAGLRELNQP